MFVGIELTTFSLSKCFWVPLTRLSTPKMKLVDVRPKEANTALLNNLVPLPLVNMVPLPLANTVLLSLASMALPVANPDIPHKVTVIKLRSKDMGTDSLASQATDQNLFSLVIPRNKATDKYNNQDTANSLSNLAMDRSLASLAIPRNKVATTNPRLGITRASSAYLPIVFS